MTLCQDDELNRMLKALREDDLSTVAVGFSPQELYARAYWLGWDHVQDDLPGPVSSFALRLELEVSSYAQLNDDELYRAYALGCDDARADQRGEW